MGPLDAEDRMPTQPCPECGANANPIEQAQWRHQAQQAQEAAQGTLTLVWVTQVTASEHYRWEHINGRMPLLHPLGKSFVEEHASQEVADLGIAQFPSKREVRISYLLEQPLTEEQRKGLEQAQQEGRVDYFIVSEPHGVSEVHRNVPSGKRLLQPAEGTQETISASQLMEELTGTKLLPGWGLVDRYPFVGDVGEALSGEPIEIPEEWKLPQSMRGKGIDTNNKPQQKGRQKNV
jgi:hypothetical protein